MNWLIDSKQDLIYWSLFCFILGTGFGIIYTNIYNAPRFNIGDCIIENYNEFSTKRYMKITDKGQQSYYAVMVFNKESYGRTIGFNELNEFIKVECTKELKEL